MTAHLSSAASVRVPTGKDRPVALVTGAGHGLGLEVAGQLGVSVRSVSPSAN